MVWRRVVVAMACAGLSLAATTEDTWQPGVASGHRGGTLGIWLHEAGVPSQGLGSTTVPEEGGEDRTAVMDERHGVGTVVVQARGPFESSTAGEAEVHVDAVLHDVRILGPGLDVRATEARATAHVRCLADGTVDVVTSTTVVGLVANGTPVGSGPTALGGTPVGLVAHEEHVDVDAGEASATALRLVLGDVELTVASVNAGIDCEPAA